jgi:hypothetical protein
MRFWEMQNLARKSSKQEKTGIMLNNGAGTNFKIEIRSQNNYRGVLVISGETELFFGFNK